MTTSYVSKYSTTTNYWRQYTGYLVLPLYGAYLSKPAYSTGNTHVEKKKAVLFDTTHARISSRKT